MKNLKDLLKGVDITAIDGAANKPIADVTCDSKIVRDGYLFVAVKGANYDGHAFIDEALNKGAVAVVAERDFFARGGAAKVLVRDSRKALSQISSNFYSRPGEHIKVIGVTGTNGKTTVTYLIESLLKEADFSTGLIGTISYKTQKRLIPATNTTPGPRTLMSLLSDMVRAKTDYCVMEVSSHALEQSRVEGITFRTAVFTNITPEHLDYHKDMGAYKRAKARLFDNLAQDGAAVLNLDDDFGKELAGALKRKNLTYGFDKKADVRPTALSLCRDGIKLSAATPIGALSINSPLKGGFNACNILAAVCAGVAERIEPCRIAKGIERLEFVPGRFQEIKCGQPFNVFVDYAHTDDALRNALTAARQITTGRILAVFGCGGNRDIAKRAKMGRIASELADSVIITTDNPRSEDPQEIADMILSGVDKSMRHICSVVLDRQKAIEDAIGLAGETDTVVIAGKGHETYQVLKDTVVPFDDVEAVCRALSSPEAQDVYRR